MILLLLLLQVPADAYELTGRSWAWQADPVEDPFFFNLDSFPSSYRRSEMEDGFIAALDVWNVQGRAPIALRYGGTTDVARETATSSSEQPCSSGTSCLGRAAVENGHSRVPEPPARIRACLTGSPRQRERSERWRGV